MLALVVRLIIDGDIESNPGPTYVIEKAIHGSYHQGDQRFGNTAGVQCACNSLYTLCWSQIKKVNSWNTSDLDHILTEGDKLYKTLNTFDMLSVDYLPRFVKMYDQNVQIEFLELEMKLVRLRDGDPLLRNIIPDSDNVLFLLFVGGNTTAIMSLQIFCYVFHSHSRDERGLNIPNGRSVLLNFRYIFEIEKYIQVAYLEFRDKQQMYFQAQFIRLKTEAIDMLSIFLNTRTVSRVKITKTIQLIFVKGKEKFILKSLVHLYMIN